MKRKADLKIKNHYFSTREIGLLDNEAERFGISVSEVLRRIIDSHFEKIEKLEKLEQSKKHVNS